MNALHTLAWQAEGPLLVTHTAPGSRLTKLAIARVASDDEKAEMWPRVVEAYKGYAGYQNKTDRNIPVVVCEPRSA